MVAAIGSFTSPPVANAGAALALALALASSPLRSRLALVAAQPLGLGALVLLAVMTAATAWSPVPWAERLSAWWHWRTLLLIVLAAAAFGEPRLKERFCLALVAATAAGALASFALRAAERTRDPGFPGTVFLNHVTQSMALAVGVLMAAVLAAQGHRPALSRALLAAAALVCLANLVLVTAGRSGQVALAVAAACAVLLMLKGSRRWQALIVLLVLILVGQVPWWGYGPHIVP